VRVELFMNVPMSEGYCEARTNYDTPFAYRYSRLKLVVLHITAPYYANDGRGVPLPASDVVIVLALDLAFC
jgi:hypothetical protein